MNVLFVAYQAASDPLMKSQGFPYMANLTKEGIDFSLLTFETKESLMDSKEYIKDTGMRVKWNHLNYHKIPRLLATLLDIFLGVFKVFFITKKDKIDVIHARGLIPALIAWLPANILKVKFFFDTRGLLADKYVGGGILSNKSFLYKLMRWFENRLLMESHFFSVETQKHAEIIKSSTNGLSKKMEIVPCCVDTDRFDYLKYKNSVKNGAFKLVYLGKEGTWYLIEEMLNFFSVLHRHFNNATFVFLSPSNPEFFLSLVRGKNIPADRVEAIRPEYNKIPALLAKSQAGIIFINPYKRYNSSPVKLGEYLASGLPVVINAGIGDCDEIISRERIGVIIKDFSVEEYERASREFKILLSEGDALRKRCRNSAIKDLSLQTGVEKYMNIYKKLA